MISRKKKKKKKEEDKNSSKAKRKKKSQHASSSQFPPSSSSKYWRARVWPFRFLGFLSNLTKEKLSPSLSLSARQG